MALAPPGGKGLDLEEVLKAYFWQAGYFVVRGVPFRLAEDDGTDIDLWLYERPAALTRRRMIVDVKNRRSPKVSERLIWTKGLQAALSVDGAIVATTDKRPSARVLSRTLNITLLDGNAVAKLTQSEQLKNTGQLTSDQLDGAVKRIDESRRTAEWRQNLRDARGSLISGMGVQSTNRTLAAVAFFGEQAVSAHPRSEQAQIALRLLYCTSALAAISLDFLLADQAFRSQEDRRRSIISSIRFGQLEADTAPPVVRAAIALARKYAENGTAIAKQIELGFHREAGQIPAEIIADYVSRIASSDTLFNVAREIERASSSIVLPSYDYMSNEAKSLLGVFLDFGGISRERIARAWVGDAQASLALGAVSEGSADGGALVGEAKPGIDADPAAAAGSREP